MSDKTTKKINKTIRKEVRANFAADFSFFTDTLKSWPFLKRLRFCGDVMMKRI